MKILFWILLSHVLVMWLNNQTVELKCKPLPRVELFFHIPELAQKAAAALDKSNFHTAKISLNKMLFKNGGRTLILTFDSHGACPSDLLSFVDAVIEVASIAHPLSREVMIPLVQDSAVAL